jgi:hypothetical protein
MPVAPEGALQDKACEGYLRSSSLRVMATVLFPIGVWMRSSGTPPSASFVPDGTRSPWVVRFSEESGSRVLKTVTEVTVGRRIAASSSIH